MMKCKYPMVKPTTSYRYGCRCAQCKAAQKAATTKWHKENPGKQRGYMKRWKEKNPEKVKQHARKWREQVRNANRDWVAEMKLESGCMDCGYNDHAIALDFDHLGDKVKAVSQMMDRSKDEILAEIRKCEVVCANCHRVRTEKRRKDSPPTPPLL